MFPVPIVEISNLIVKKKIEMGPYLPKLKNERLPISHKWLTVERNGVKMGLEVVVTCIWGTFDLLVFNAIFGRSVQLSQMVHNSKTPGGCGAKFGTWG